MHGFRYWFKKRLAWMRVRVRGGPLRGLWISGNCGVRFIRGDYDSDAVSVISGMIAPGMIVYDVGAHVGYLSMMASRQVGPAGKVVAFEPLALNLRYLRGHIRANGLDNIAVVEACVSELPGMVHFDTHKGTGRGYLVQGDNGAMRAISIDEEVLSRRLPAPGFIKMDVEGAELLALRGAERTLRAHRPALVLSVHSTQLDEDCCRFLRSLGYELTRIKPNTLAAVWKEPQV